MSEIRNIGPKGCKRRIKVSCGILGFSGVYLVFLLITRGSALLWIPLLITTFIGFIYLLQAVEKTCIILAAQGIEVMNDSNRERVKDNEIARKLRNLTPGAELLIEQWKLVESDR